MESRWSLFVADTGRAVAGLSLLLVFACVHPLGARAQFMPQYDDSRVIRLHYRNSSGEQGTTTLHYRRDGALASEFWTLNDRTRYSANHYVLDAQGRPVEKHRVFSDSLTSREVFTYGGDGHRLGESFERSDGKAGSARYDRDAQGRLLAADCDNYKGWLTCRIEYAYDDDRRSSATLLHGPQSIGSIAYEYDSSGRLASEVWDFNGRFSQTFTYEYEPVPGRVFDASSPLMSRNPRFQVVAEDYDFNGRGGGPSHYEYDDDGRLLKKVFERNDGLRTETTFVFDDRGSLVSSHRAYHDGGSADFAYEYDGALRLTGKTFRRSDGAEGLEKYAYDRLGRLVSAVYRNMDFWLNGTIEFEYDGRGHLHGGRFTAEDENSADLAISTDAEGNVANVAWVFDRGFTQTYEFRYAPAPVRTRRD